MLNAIASDAAKLAGQQMTLDYSGDWKNLVLSELRAWLDQRRARGEHLMTFEEFREAASNQPNSHKSWGALATWCKNLGWIEAGSYVKAKSLRTHSHPVMQWRIV